MEFDKTHIYVQLQHPVPTNFYGIIHGNIFWKPRKFGC